MSVIENERLVGDEELAALLGDDAPAAILPAPDARPLTTAGRLWAIHLQRATRGHGWWGDHPAALAVLKEWAALQAKRRVHWPIRWIEHIFRWAITLPGHTVAYGLLWGLGRPVYRQEWIDGPPSLSELRNEIRSRGRVGRWYGYAVVLWMFALAYGFLWVLQRPIRLLVAIGYLTIIKITF
jgi:hypothetical protein